MDGNVRSSQRGRVQSVDRSVTLLETLVNFGGIASLSELSAATDLPGATIHRLMATLRDAGYVRQEASRRYALGVKLVRLGDTAGELVGAWVKPALARLVQTTGETANMAMLDGNQAVYMAQVPSPHMVRMFTEVGLRVDLHCTAVGKALLAHLKDSQIRELLGRRPMVAMTSATITDIDELIEHVQIIRYQGYAVDEEENEEGVRCLAVSTLTDSTAVALSVSGPETRFTLERLDETIPVLMDVVRKLPNSSSARDRYLP